MNICFYHRVDLDGICSGAIVKHFEKDIECIGFDYHDKFPWEKLSYGMKVYFVDCMIQPYADILKIYDIVKEGLFIFDHHISFLNTDAFKFLQEKIPNNLYCNTKIAGCELTYTFFTLQDLNKNKNFDSKFIRLLGQYDSWRDTEAKKLKNDYDWESEVMPFQFGMRIDEWTPESLANHIENNSLDIKKYIEFGKVILKYQDQQNSIVMKTSFDAEIEGYKCLCVNGSMKNSRVFHSKWDNKKYDFMVPFSMTKERKWSWSFYTDRKDRDASQIAKVFGGGGHKGAAGCITDDLIFK